MHQATVATEPGAPLSLKERAHQWLGALNESWRTKAKTKDGHHDQGWDQEPLEAVSEPLVRVSGFVPDQEAQEELTPPASVSDSPELVSAPASPQAAAGGEVASAREQGAVAAAALQEPPARSSGQSPSAMLAKMAEALQAHAQLTERYAQAGYRIGKLEAEVKHLQLERQRMASRLAESEQTLADSRLNERVLEVERDRALAALGQAREELASAGLSLKASQPGVWNWLRRNW